ncbi:MAG: hypothetical protein ABSA11_09005 [Candidatus Bathyarchaeia archaeon]|jgi:uncharacterized protein (DUF3084 family)
MDSRFYLLLLIGVIGGLIGGYFIASTLLQNQIGAYEVRIQSQDAVITTKDALLQVQDTQIKAQDTQIKAQDTQIKAQDQQLQAQSTLIQTQENLLQQLKANITKLQEQIQSISDQLQTRVGIDSVTWGSDSFTLDVRNTGLVNAVVESVSIRVNQAGSSSSTFEIPSIRSSIPVGSNATITLTYQWATSTSYVIRVTTNTGFYYEAVFTSPSA